MRTYIRFLEPYEKEISKKFSKKGLTITVSGVSGSGKSTVARAISKEFGLKRVHSGKIFREEAEKRGMRLEEFSSIREKELDYLADKKNLEYAIKGNCAIDARLSGWCAGDWADARIFVDSTREKRIERVARRDKISVEDAKKVVTKRDGEDNKKYGELYGVDMFDKKIYNIVINNNDITLKELNRISIEELKKFLPTS